MTRNMNWVLFLTLSSLANQAWGQGYLFTPPARGTAWRKGFDTPINYSDKEMHCGGFNTQWKVNDGKCGICGDPWNGKRENEAPGGKYATGTIVATYISGQHIDVEIKVTTNHKGWFEFKLCENNNIHQDKDQSCFDKNLLEFEDGETRVTVPKDPNGLFKYKIKLPEGLQCDQCILQWHWNCGNNWGCDDKTGECCLGCGPQETFWGCADITIQGSGPHNTTIPIPSTSGAKTTKPVPVETTTKPNTDNCHAIPPYDSDPGMDEWCKTNCKVGNCPPDVCSCDPRKVW